MKCFWKFREKTKNPELTFKANMASYASVAKSSLPVQSAVLPIPEVPAQPATAAPATPAPATPSRTDRLPTIVFPFIDPFFLDRRNTIQEHITDALQRHCDIRSIDVIRKTGKGRKRFYYIAFVHIAKWFNSVIYDDIIRGESARVYFDSERSYWYADAYKTPAADRKKEHKKPKTRPTVTNFPTFKVPENESPDTFSIYLPRIDTRSIPQNIAHTDTTAIKNYIAYVIFNVSQTSIYDIHLHTKKAGRFIYYSAFIHFLKDTVYQSFKEQVTDSSKDRPCLIYPAREANVNVPKTSFWIVAINTSKPKEDESATPTRSTRPHHTHAPKRPSRIDTSFPPLPTIKRNLHKTFTKKDVQDAVKEAVADLKADMEATMTRAVQQPIPIYHQPHPASHVPIFYPPQHPHDFLPHDSSIPPQPPTDLTLDDLRAMDFLEEQELNDRLADDPEFQLLAEMDKMVTDAEKEMEEMAAAQA